MADAETIWIIGAGDGIGAALAHEWAGRWARLILSARSADRLGDLATDLGPAQFTMPLDVSDRASIESAATRIADIGPLDRAVHLAALYDPGRLADQDPDRPAQIVTAATGLAIGVVLGGDAIRSGQAAALLCLVGPCRRHDHAGDGTAPLTGLRVLGSSPRPDRMRAGPL